MQQPRGIAVVLGVVFGLLIVGVVVGGILLFKEESKTPPEPVNANAALQLSCSVDSDCVSYCGTDPCYQPICGVTTIGAAGSCTCRSICGPISPDGNTNATTNANSNTNVNASTNANVNANSTVSTTTWKLYTNTGSGYTIKYPSDWKVSEKFGLDTLQLLPPGIETQSQGGNDLAGAVTIRKVAETSELDAVVNRKPITINGVVGEQGDDLGIVNFNTVILKSGNNTFKIMWNTNRTTSIYETIRNSFTFTE